MGTPGALLSFLSANSAAGAPGVGLRFAEESPGWVWPKAVRKRSRPGRPTPHNPPQTSSLCSEARGPRVRGHVSQKRTIGGPDQKRPEEIPRRRRDGRKSGPGQKRPERKTDGAETENGPGGICQPDPRGEGKTLSLCPRRASLYRGGKKFFAVKGKRPLGRSADWNARGFGRKEGALVRGASSF